LREYTYGDFIQKAVTDKPEEVIGAIIRGIIEMKKNADSSTPPKIEPPRNRCVMAIIKASGYHHEYRAFGGIPGKMPQFIVVKENII